MRQLTLHQVEGLGTQIKIDVKDEPSHAHCCHRYELSGFDTISNPSIDLPHDRVKPTDHVTIFLQQDAVQHRGRNGVTMEALIAICADHLMGLQSGPFSTPGNAEVLEHLLKSLEIMKTNTAKSVSLGVHGTGQYH